MANKIEVIDQSIFFYCPGCDGFHAIEKSRWQWNGSFDAPTFIPSVLVTYPANPNAGEEFREWRKERKCHSYVTDGKIEFLTDSTHNLAGQTVDLPDFD